MPLCILQVVIWQMGGSKYIEKQLNNSEKRKSCNSAHKRHPRRKQLTVALRLPSLAANMTGAEQVSTAEVNRRAKRILPPVNEWIKCIHTV